MKRITKQQITDLYCDLAAHLLSIPEITQSGSSVATWLAERVLTGLPDNEAYLLRPQCPYTGTVDVFQVVADFCYPDSTNNQATTFLQYMLKAADGLVELNLPRFARHLELAELHSETGAPR